MSHTNKKGKTLTTKRKNNKSGTKAIRSQSEFGNNTGIFDSFVSVRTSKQHKDASLLSAQSSNSLTQAQENETDFFKFPARTSSCSVDDKIFLETTIPLHENIFDENSKIDISILDSCSKPEEKIDDSSLFFESVSERNFKSEGSPKAKSSCKPDEEDSTKHMSFDENVSIPDISDLQKPKLNAVTDTNLPQETGDSELDTRNQCPVCFKTVVAAKYFSHIKSCAAKNKLSTQQLISALRLHKKQLAERKELGLGIPGQSYKARVSPKRSRTNERKGPVDSGLQLALALSASLHSAQEDEVIQEAEVLKEAGLCAEAEQKLSTLEKYGFASALPVQPRTATGGSKSRPQPPSLLLRRTQEERERIVTEKVAIILISEEESLHLTSFTYKDPTLKSKVLKKKCNNESWLWRMARCPEDEKREGFYVKSLSQFVSPSKGEVGESLRRLSQLPGRLNTPMKGDNSDLSTPCKSFIKMEETSLSKMPTPLRTFVSEKDKSLLQLEETDISDLPTPLRSEVPGRGTKFDSIAQNHTNKKMLSTLSCLSKDWEKLVNNSVLSDIKIQCKECEVPAHKLVFHVRCPRTLNEVVKQGSYDILDWKGFSTNSVLAFLEFVYCGKSDKIFVMDTNDFLALNSIADRLDYTELKINLHGAKKSASESKKIEVKKNLFRSDDTNDIRVNIAKQLDSSDQSCASDSVVSEHVKISCEKISSTPSSLNSEIVSGGRESPDMFGDSNVTGDEIESKQERDELAILVSLMEKPTQYTVDSNKKFNSFEKGEIMEIDSPEGSYSSEIMHKKRKASNASFSEEEDISLLKKRCSDVSSCDKPTEETHDLTQSSNSSSGGVDEKSKHKSSLEAPDEDTLQQESSQIKYSEEAFDLTQSSKSSNDDANEYNKCKSKTINSPDESDSDDPFVDLTQKHCDESIPKNGEVPPSMNKDWIDPIWDGYHHEEDNYNVNTPKKSPGKTAEGKSMIDSTDSTGTKLSTPKSSTSKLIDSSKCSSRFSSSDRKSLSDEFSYSPHNISSRKESDDILLEDNNVQDYIDPVWEGYDDYYQFNCTINSSLKTPLKYQQDKSLNLSLPHLSTLEKNNSKQISVSPKSYSANISSSYYKSPRKFSQTTLSPLNRTPKSITSISSGSKSPRLLSQKQLTPSSTPSMKYVSSDSKSPKCLSQKVLNDSSPTYDYSSKQGYHNLSNNETDIELIHERSSTVSVVPHQTDFTKTRKNLSFQFGAYSDGCKRTYSEDGEDISSDQALSQISHKSKNPPESSLRKDSLAAMQRLLDDSFEVNDSIFNAADALARDNGKDVNKEVARQSKSSTEQGGKVVEKEVARQPKSSTGQDGALAGNSRSKTLLDTPSPGIIVSDKVTPLADYSGMKTPALKKELSRFGLKPSLGRRKAKLLLRYIYDQTHPVIPDAGGQAEVFRQPEGRPPRSPVKTPRKTQSAVGSPRKAKTSIDSPQKTQTTVNLVDSESESDDPCSQMSTSSSLSSSASLPEESYHEAEDILTQDLSDSGDMRSCLRSLIKGDPELHRKVLMYEPIYLEDLMAMLKSKCIKSKANDVMDFLDEQSITFRTNSWKATNEKRRLKQKSPKKKTKPETAGKLTMSPSKALAQGTKKRGRPKKTQN